jgi:F0F1-type ATP synthase membrane subunit b/b'
MVIAALVVIPIIYKDDIVNLVKSETNKQLNATVNFSNNIGLSLLSSFPDFTLTLRDLSVAGKNDFEGDTLIQIESISITIDLMSVIKGNQFKVNKIQLIKPTIEALVLPNGKANWDIATADTTTTAAEPADTSSSFSIALKRFTIQEGNIRYDDKQSNLYASLTGLNQELEGDFSTNQFILKLITNCDALTYKMGGIPYLLNAQLSIKAELDANMQTMEFVFKDNEIGINALTFGIDGWVKMPTEAIEMDLKYVAKKASVKEFISLVPGMYTKDFDAVQTTGKLSFNGWLKGKYTNESLPAFDFKLNLENGSIQYPEMPVKMNDIQLAFQASNPDGVLNNTNIELQKLHMVIGKDAFDAFAKTNNIMVDPIFEAGLNGRIDLGQLQRFVPLDSGMNMQGLIIANINAAGKVSTLQNQQYEQVKADGQIDLNQFMFKTPDLPSAFTIETARLIFNPTNIKLTNFKSTLGESDFNMEGELSNFFSYILADGTLKGKLNFQSNYINMNSFLSEEPAETTTSTQDTSVITAPEIPTNIDFTLNAAINKLTYTNMDITALKGTLQVANQQLKMNQVRMNTLDAAINMNGVYETSNPLKPSMEFDFGITGMSFKNAFKTFNTVQKIAPVAEKMNGNFSTTFKLKSQLDQALNPIYDSLFAEGTVTIPQAGLENIALFSKAAEVLQYPALNNPSLSNVAIQFKVENGRVYTKPFTVMVGQQQLVLEGSSGLDQSLKYLGKINFPRSAAGKGNNAIDQLLTEANQKAGTNVQLSNTIPVQLGIGGTFTKPTITTNLADLIKNEAGSLQNQLAAEANRKKAELEAKARAEIERVRKEQEARAKAELDKAKAEADRLKKEAETKAKAEADRLKKEAEAKAKAEQERLKKQAEEEAKKKLKGLLGK